jgi:hypothetical protein
VGGRSTADPPTFLARERVRTTMSPLPTTSAGAVLRLRLNKRPTLQSPHRMPNRYAGQDCAEAAGDRADSTPWASAGTVSGGHSKVFLPTANVFTSEKRYWTVIVVDPVAVRLPLSGEVKVAVTVAVPGPAVTASPALFTTSTVMSEEDQVTRDVTS